MLKDKLNDLIKESMMAREKTRLEVIRMIKTAFMEAETAKNAKPLDEPGEIAILKKMVSQYTESAEGYAAVGNQEMYDEQMQKVSILKEFLPEEVSEEVVRDAIVAEIGDTRDMKQMGKYMAMFKSKFPGVDGKVLSTIIKETLCS